MILATNTKLTIGKVVHIEMTDANGIPMGGKIPCLIIKRVTIREFEECFLEKWPIERLIRTKGYNANYFYEFSTD